MDKLKKDIEKIIFEAGTNEIKIIFAIDNNSHLVQMISKLHAAGYCENASSWTSSKATVKAVFDAKTSNFIELDVNQNAVTYSTIINYKDALERRNRVALETANYLVKHVRKKLAL